MISAFYGSEGEALATAIGRGATVCAATQRLARMLRQAWIARMREQDAEVWRTPDILPFSSWQQRMARALAEHLSVDVRSLPSLLEDQQELLTWEQAAVAAGVLDGVLQPQQIAAAMMDAYATARVWDIPIGKSSDLCTGDAGAFRAVLEQVELRWRQIGVASGAGLAWRAEEAVRRLPRLLPDEIVFVGFDLPADAAFRATLHALGQGGSLVHMHRADTPPAQARMLRYPAFEDELHAAAAWCRDLLTKGEGDIGIIIPHLDSVRAMVERVFADVLQPVASRNPQREHEILFELSLGPRAIDEPLIHSAFLLLDLLRPTLPLEQWTRTLHSPFLRGASQYSEARALLDAELRRRGMREAAARDLLHGAERIECGTGDPFLDAIGRVGTDFGRLKVSEWTDVFVSTLDAFGWPGDRGLGSREFQARNRIEELLEQFSALDTVAAPMTLTEALGRFRLLAATSVFQVKSTGAPVQIMGVRESAGLRFAHCRILGMNDDIWPPVTRPASFLPIQLQRRAGVPAASPERFLEQVRQQTDLLLRTAPEVLFTCSAADGERELLPSPLLADLEAEDIASVRRDVITALAGTARERLGELRDDRGPRVTEGERIRGGSSILTLQSACPFRAFAEQRLHAARPEPVEHGVRSLDRGTLVHSVMEALWRNLRDQRTLLSLPEGELRRLVAEHIDTGIAEQRALKGRRVPAHLIEAERECVLMLVMEWLEFERSRTPFTAEVHEERVEVDIAGLTLRLRADRIDRLQDGSSVLIDYKSGKKTAADWMSARPVEPQIPLYISAMGEDLRASAFAVLSRGACRIAGLRDDTLDAPEFQGASEYLAKYGQENSDWNTLRAQWRSVLHELASAFLAGDAAVDPRNGDDTCRWCSLPSLCRVRSGAEMGVHDDTE